MEVSFIKDDKKELWNDFLIRNKGSFLQSFEWGEFQKKLQKKVWRIEIKEDNEILFQTQVIEEKNRFKSYFYIPYGPIFKEALSSEEKKRIFSLFLDKIQNLAKEEKVIFFRIEPISPLPEFNFQDPGTRIQPKRTLILNIDPSEEELIKTFHQKTRYNIRLAEKKGVEIKILDKYSDIFYKLLKKTKERQEFRSYPEDYYKKLLEINSPYFKTNLFLAEYQGKTIVASIIIFFANRATSLHTGSDYRYRIVKGPHLLRWKTILEAKERGCKEYDLWGIDEKKWPGVSYLKRGFGGRQLEYGPAKDIVFQNSWYRIYKILKRLL